MGDFEATTNPHLDLAYNQALSPPKDFIPVAVPPCFLVHGQPSEGQLTQRCADPVTAGSFSGIYSVHTLVRGVCTGATYRFRPVYVLCAL